MRFSQVAFSVTLVVLAVSAGPISISEDRLQRRAAPFALQNSKDAQTLNQHFRTLSPNSSCNSGEQACVQGQFANCINGTFTVEPCASGLKCFALPLVNKAGTRYVRATHIHETVYCSIFSSLWANISTTVLLVIPNKTPKRVSRTPVPQVVSSESARS